MDMTHPGRPVAVAPLSRSLLWSVAAHAAAVLGLVWFASSYLRVVLPAPEPKAFTLVPGHRAEVALGVAEAPLISFRAPRVVAPRPQPAPIASNAAPVRPAVPKPTPVAPVRAPAAKNGEQMTIDEFQRRHGSNSRSTTAHARGPAPAVMHVDLSTIDDVGSARTGGIPRTTGSDGEGEFLAYLQRELSKAYRSDDDTAAELAVRVRFSLRTDGSVDRADLVRSSGDPAFDQSALAVFKRLRLAVLRAEFAGRPFEITFRTRAN